MSKKHTIRYLFVSLRESREMLNFDFKEICVLIAYTYREIKKIVVTANKRFKK